MKRFWTVCLLLLLLLTGCQKQQVSDFASFSYGCTLESAMEVLGLTESMSNGSKEWEDGSVKYWFSDEKQLATYGGELILTDQVLTIAGKSVPLGITEICFRFDTMEEMEAFWDTHIRADDTAYCLADEVDEIWYGFGDWSEYANSENLGVLETILQAEFDAEKCQKKLPPISVRWMRDAAVYGEYMISVSGFGAVVAQYPQTIG